MNRFNRFLGFVSALVAVWSGGVLPSLSIQFDSSPQLLSRRPCIKPPKSPPGKVPPGGTSELKYQFWLAGSENVALLALNPSQELLANLDDCGYGAGSQLKNMNGLTRQELLQYLTNNGFNPTGKPSPKGWQTFRHEDRSLVFVNWVEKRIVRNEAPIYGSDGAKVNNG